MAVGAVMLWATSGFARPNWCEDTTQWYRDCGSCHQDESSCKTTPPSACTDNDSDGYGNPGDSSCANPGTDCNDSNASINPAAAENCTDGIDNNCDGLVDTQDRNAVNCPLNCSDSDGDTYSPDGGECGATDCDDNAANINPGTFESCDDGVDNDCNNRTDCDDSACSGDPACVLDFCEDYGDRESCKADSRCSWSGKGKNCFEDVVSDDQLNCEADGGRWNKKKVKCRTR